MAAAMAPEVAAVAAAGPVAIIGLMMAATRGPETMAEVAVRGLEAVAAVGPEALKGPRTESTGDGGSGGRSSELSSPPTAMANEAKEPQILQQAMSSNFW